MADGSCSGTSLANVVYVNREKKNCVVKNRT